MHCIVELEEINTSSDSNEAMSKTCIVIGAGHAAAQFAPGLRQEGWQGKIIVIGDESHPPYHRPPLSKAFLAGEKTERDIYIRPPDAYEKAGIEFKPGARVDSIDREKKQVALSSGATLAYDKLALMTGSRVRYLERPGADLAGIHYLRTIADAECIKKDMGANKHAVVVGGGYIGLETAAILQQSGMNVTVIEMMERVLQRVTAPDISAFYHRIHTQAGVSILCNTGLRAFVGDGHVREVVCSDGRTLPARLVIVGVGIVPNVELAAAAGLKVENGIVVDEFARTSDHDIVSAGDCTWHYNNLYQRWCRLESVQNASEQAQVAAMTLCGKKKAYDALPWFWSDQYDLKLQIAGLSQGYDEVITRGDKESGRSFAAFYLQDDVVIAVDAINKPPEFMIGKRLIMNKVKADKDRLADADMPMKAVLEPM